MKTVAESVDSCSRPLLDTEFLSDRSRQAGKDPFSDAALSLLSKQVMHDVRGNLVSLAVTAKLLQRGSFGLLPDDINKQIGVLEKKANAAAGLLEDYCRLAVAAGSGGLRFDERLDFSHDVIIPVVQELAMELDNKGIALVRESEPGRQYMAAGNKLLLQGVFRTLLHNAIRHSSKKGTITVGLKEQGRQLCISIANEGAVVPEHLRQRIFKEYIKADPAGSAQATGSGLGLGLFLARDAINRHGGDIRHEPMPGGTKFVLTLPAA